jgi:DNA-binding GntR family transcriptional regulator
VKLDSPGLVAPVGFKGALVADISREAAEGLYEFRSLLDGCADRRAVTHLTHDALSQARDLANPSPPEE